MKKNALRKDFFREIRGSLNRFLSILCIVALGVAFYTGIRASQPDMQLSADALYDAQNMMDLRVISTLGLTQDDVEAMKAIEGITDAEGGYSAYALSGEEGLQAVVSVQSIAENMNRLSLTSGRLPEKADECFLDEAYLSSAGLSLGDTIVLYADEGDDLSDTLANDTFTIVGAGSYAWFLNFDRGTADIGNGDVRYFMMVPKEAFNLEAYTVAYMTADGADELLCYGDEYKDYIAQISDRIEAIADERCEIRYQEIQDEGAEKIADAKQEIADGEQEMEDAREKLADAKIKLDDAAAKIADGEREITDGEQEIADAKAEIRRQQRTIDDGWIELNDAKTQLSDAAQEIEDAQRELSSGAARASNSRAQLNQQAAQFEAFASQAETLKSAESYQTAKDQYDALKQAQDMGIELDAEQNQALTFYDNIIPQVDSALTQSGMPATDESLSAVIDGALQPTRSQISSGYEQLHAADKTIERGREQLKDAQTEYDTAVAEIAENEQKLLDGQAELDEARHKVRRAEQELEDGRQELEEGKREYEDALKEYEDARAEFDEKSADAEKDIAQAKRKVADAEQELSELELPEWYVLDRESIQSYVEYGMDTERIGALGKVFPAIFFLVAALVSLATMTRMVEEGRLQIGTIKALGYSKASIAGKYIGYALAATLIGSVLGIALGSRLLPYVIISAYGILYVNMTVMLTPIQWGLSISAMLIAVLCTVLATLLACYAELAATPATLMRPTAPPQGKRVLIERITWLWKRMSFSQKATFRNLFRYKKRLLMTIFGIGACMGLLLVAFGLRNSISEIVDKQYTAVWTYDTSVSVDTDEPERLEEIKRELEAMPEVTAQLPAKVVSIDGSANGTTKSVYLFVPEDVSALDAVVSLQDRADKQLVSLTDEGVVITEKLSRLLDIGAGDEIALVHDETDEVRARVLGVTENYLYHYVYMTPVLYEQLYEEQPVYTSVFLSTDHGEEDEKELGRRMLAIDGITGISFVSDLQAQVADMMQSLNLVVWVLVISAGLLAFIVLYNLNNISIIERRRELATLKVLGFHDEEVAAYVYRENVWLTCIGVVLGMAIGYVLHKFVIQTCEVDMIMFGQDIRFMSYLYSVALTFLFALIVNFFMFFKLRKIDMVESLKSIE